MLSSLFRQYEKLSSSSKCVLRNIFFSCLLKGGGLLLSFLMLPAYVRFFNNNELLGVWYTLFSMVNWILNFDIGIGNGLRNKLTEAIGRNDSHAASGYISSAYIAVGAVVVAVVILLVVALRYADLYAVFNITPEIIAEKELYWSISIIVIGIGTQMFLRLISSIIFALQNSALNDLTAFCSMLTIYLFIVIARPDDQSTSLIVMSWVFLFAVNIPLLLCTILLFCTKLKNMRPRWSMVRLRYMNGIFMLGGIFFFVQIAYMLLMNTNEYLIGKFTSQIYVVEYQFYHRIFTIIGIAYMLVLTPVWSAVTKEITAGNLEWVRNLYHKLLLFGIFGVGFEFMLIPFLQTIFNLWLGDRAIKVDYAVAIQFALFGSIMIFSGIFASIANGLGKLRTQMIIFGIGIFVKILLSYWLIQKTGNWEGVIAASSIVMFFYSIIQPLVLHRYLNKEL